MPARGSPVLVMVDAETSVVFAHKCVIGLTRVLTDALEANIKHAIGPNTPVMTFTVSHAPTIVNRFSVHQDGKTSDGEGTRNVRKQRTV